MLVQNSNNMQWSSKKFNQKEEVLTNTLIDFPVYLAFPDHYMWITDKLLKLSCMQTINFPILIKFNLFLINNI